MKKSDARATYLQYLDAAGINGAPDDATMTAKFNLMLSPAQIYVASLRDDEKILTFNEGDLTASEDGGDYFAEIPAGMRKLLRVEGGGVSVRWAMTGGKIQIEGDADFPITIGYTKVPDTIEATAPDSTDLEIAEDLQQLVPIYAAVLATTADDDDRNTSAWLRTIFGEMAQNITTKDTGTASMIDSVCRIGM